MGDNYSYSVIEEQVVSLYDLGILTLEVLDILVKAFGGGDIDSGGSNDLESKDGLSFEQICVKLVTPEWVAPQTDDEDEAITIFDDHWYNLKKERWNWC